MTETEIVIIKEKLFKELINLHSDCECCRYDTNTYECSNGLDYCDFQLSTEKINEIINNCTRYPVTTIHVDVDENAKDYKQLKKHLKDTLDEMWKR